METHKSCKPNQTKITIKKKKLESTTQFVFAHFVHTIFIGKIEKETMMEAMHVRRAKYLSLFRNIKTQNNTVNKFKYIFWKYSDFIGGYKSHKKSRLSGKVLTFSTKLNYTEILFERKTSDSTNMCLNTNK